jgi:hypothetical protein
LRAARERLSAADVLSVFAHAKRLAITHVARILELVMMVS